MQQGMAAEEEGALHEDMSEWMKTDISPQKAGEGVEKSLQFGPVGVVSRPWPDDAL